ncbi:MAG: thioredoxin domain-containing protein [Gammaproteobacteria bacterium]|nr:thioredoxin domain-containing protein [Gammaproteobacteria bacterium]
MPNALSHETSPYLLQHAHNPVDWQPWGDAALQQARDQDKPILLSIGYSACHWCHVMERESFENKAIAARMNELFVCIKVDREERPDLDKIYQTAHQFLTERPGGWPLTVALTPNGHAPFFAGTYFPPAPRMGMPGFGEVLQRVAAHYQEHRARMGGHERAFGAAMARLNPPPSTAQLPTAGAALAQAAAELARQFDREFGGFGGAPKFPHPTQLELLLRHAALRDGGGDGDGGDGGDGRDGDGDGGRDGDDGDNNNGGDNNNSPSARMLDLTLRKMASGGLFDQLGGGFYRYSVDRQWRIPHFEKMLYDNAQLLALYSDAAQYFGAPLYRRIAEQTAAWVMREMQQAHGGYASTLDADSEGVEGKYYVWSDTDLRALLRADEFDALSSFYDLAGEPNFEGQWHLTVHPESEHRAADAFAPGDGDDGTGDGRDGAGDGNGNAGDGAGDGAAALRSARAKLLATRDERIRPALDDKILTAWNGMMVKGMARAAGVFGRDDFADSATAALDFIRAAMWQDGRLRVTCRGGEARLNGYLDDYAFLAEGIVELLQVRWRAEDLAFAVDICDAMLAHFEDRQAGGFFFTSHDHERLLYRPKTGPDDAIPSGNAAAARALFKLGNLLGETRYLEAADNTLRLFAAALDRMPSIHGLLCMALQAREPSNPTIIIRGRPAQTAAWRALCRRRYHPEQLAVAIPPQTPNLPPALAARQAAPGNQTVAYLCHANHCSAPLNSPAELEAQLKTGEPGRG